MYVELHCHTPYSYLDGASSIEDLVRQAAILGMPALAVTDHNSLTAAVKFNTHCKDYGLLPIFGTELTLNDGSHLTLLAATRVGYSTICRILSQAYSQGGRRSPSLQWDELPTATEGVICLSGCRKGRLSRLILERRYEEALSLAQKLKRWFGKNLYIELQDDLTPGSRSLCHNLALLARQIDTRVVATNNVHYNKSNSRIAHDVKRCIALGITLGEIHPERPFNGERYLKPAREMADLFQWCPEAISNTMHLAEICGSPGVLPLEEEIVPTYPSPGGESVSQILRNLSYEGARRRCGPPNTRVINRLEEELQLLDRLGHSSFVLHAARIVRWARSQNIMVTGRGSGADSLVCYCLGLTDIDVIKRNLPIARWVAPGKKPDIDIDFEHRRRDDVFRWISATYGVDNVALCCTYITYWAKGALRDVGKALGFPSDILSWFHDTISSSMHALEIKEEFAKSAALSRHAAFSERFDTLFSLCRSLAGHPRHLGSHSSGLVIGAIPLWKLNVLSPSARGVMPIIMLDKDDVEEAGAIKLDILSLPMLSVVTDAAQSISTADHEFRYESIPLEDTNVYQMLWTGSNMGLFQLGSPAQANLATRLHPRDFEDLVASIGLIRPGPIKSRAVQKYVAVRNGYARIEFLHPALQPILERTYGVCCFQEQVSYIISAMMGLSDADAEVWRKKLAKHDRAGTMDQAREEFIDVAMHHHSNLTHSNAHRIMDELQGWSSLGFVEGHSASFALTGQKSAYMMHYYPAQFYAALLSNQPCGFYPPQSLAAEARRRGIDILPVDINESQEACTVDHDGRTIRLGLCLVARMNTVQCCEILAERRDNPFRSLLDLCLRVPLPKDCLENLILCGAFESLHEHTRGLLWRLDDTVSKALSIRSELINKGQQLLGLRFVGVYSTPCSDDIADLSVWDKLMWQWRVTGVTASCHPFAWLRESLMQRGVLSAHEAMEQKSNSIVTVAGLNIRPHRPPAKKGGRHLFTTLEDESDYIQVAFYDRSIERCMATVLLSSAIVVRGVLKRHGLGVSLEAQSASPLSLDELRSSNTEYARDQEALSAYLPNFTS